MLPGPRHYRTHLKNVVATSAAPYGYTLTIWTSGAVATHRHGIPSTSEALLFLLGAVLGFALTAALAHGSPVATFAADRDRRPVRLWGGFHLISVGGAIGIAAAAADLLGNPLVWLFVGFLSTTVYLTLTAAQFTLAERKGDAP